MLNFRTQELFIIVCGGGFLICVIFGLAQSTDSTTTIEPKLILATEFPETRYYKVSWTSWKKERLLVEIKSRHLRTIAEIIEMAMADIEKKERYTITDTEYIYSGAARKGMLISIKKP